MHSDSFTVTSVTPIIYFFFIFHNLSYKIILLIGKFLYINFQGLQ